MWCGLPLEGEGVGRFAAGVAVVKPGVTGWAQINGWRGETDTLEKMRRRLDYDLEYVRTWSLLLDLKIIGLTIVRGFFDKNVY